MWSSRKSDPLPLSFLGHMINMKEFGFTIEEARKIKEGLEVIGLSVELYTERSWIDGTGWKHFRYGLRIRGRT